MLAAGIDIKRLAVTASMTWFATTLMAQPVEAASWPSWALVPPPLASARSRTAGGGGPAAQP
jgi:hypothetical protein